MITRTACGCWNRKAASIDYKKPTGLRFDFQKLIAHSARKACGPIDWFKVQERTLKEKVYRFLFHFACGCGKLSLRRSCGNKGGESRVRCESEGGKSRVGDKILTYNSLRAKEVKC